MPLQRMWIVKFILSNLRCQHLSYSLNKFRFVFSDFIKMGWILCVGACCINCFFKHEILSKYHPRWHSSLTRKAYNSYYFENIYSFSVEKNLKTPSEIPKKNDRFNSEKQLSTKKCIISSFSIFTLFLLHDSIKFIDFQKFLTKERRNFNIKFETLDTKKFQ